MERVNLLCMYLLPDSILLLIKADGKMISAGMPSNEVLVRSDELVGNLTLDVSILGFRRRKLTTAIYMYKIVCIIYHYI